jgi:gluconolactonase
VKDGFTWSEGPVPAPGGGIYFSDVYGKKLYLLDKSDKLTVVQESTTGANGLYIDKAGDVYAAEGEPGKRISHANQTGHPVTVIDQVNGKPFGAPNDLMMDSLGGIYFTNPTAMPTKTGPPGDVYYLPPHGKDPVLLDNQLTFPNGIVLTTDEKVLLVGDTYGTNIWAYDVQPDGSVKNKRVFATVPLLTDGSSFSDGICIDSKNRVYLTTTPGVQVFDRSGAFLGLIKLPVPSSNCAFAGPSRKSLYVTARKALYRFVMESQGPKRSGK